MPAFDRINLTTSDYIMDSTSFSVDVIKKSVSFSRESVLFCLVGMVMLMFQ